MELSFRMEEPLDYRTVEELTREAFWNLHVPGCSEHLLAHQLRSCGAFVPALDFVALAGGEIAGNIMYCRARVAEDSGEEHGVLTFGPVSVWPRLQKQGVGSALIRHSLKAAAKMSFEAVLIYGDPAYYRRFGFRAAEMFGIRTSEGRFHPALQALELAPGALDGVGGRFFEGDAYHVDQKELDEFDRIFPHREKLVTESQKRFQELQNS